MLTWQDKFGRNAVHVASQYGARDCVVTLKLNDASLETQTNEGFTPIYLAAKNSHCKVREAEVIVMYVRECGGSVNQSAVARKCW